MHNGSSGDIRNDTESLLNLKYKILDCLFGIIFQILIESYRQKIEI